MNARVINLQNKLIFYLIIFADGHIMNNPFVAIVPRYALVVQYGHVKPVSVRLILQGWSNCHCVLLYICPCMRCHTNAMNLGAAIVTRPSQ